MVTLMISSDAAVILNTETRRMRGRERIADVCRTIKNELLGFLGTRICHFFACLPLIVGAQAVRVFSMVLPAFQGFNPNPMGRETTGSS